MRKLWGNSNLSRGSQYKSQLHALRLELEKTRSQAEAARLEARAAELELEIARLNAGLEPASTVLRRFDAGHPDLATECKQEETSDMIAQSAHSGSPDGFFSWDHVRSTIRRKFRDNESLERPQGVTAVEANARASSDLAKDFSSDAKKSDTTTPAAATIASNDRSLRIDQSHANGIEREDNNAKNSETEAHETRGVRFANDAVADPVSISAQQDDMTERPARSRPAAWMISALVHAGILLLLGIFTLSNQRPGDAVALAGSVAETDEIAIETISIETQQMEVSESDPVPSEMEYELSDAGELAITELAMDAPPAPPSPLLDSLSDHSMTNQAMMSLKSDSDSTMKFCGVEGGGNHFVYLVDSSGSMGDAFESARLELLQSIDALQPDQKFYVIFFDAESDYMRLASLDRDETKSAYATPTNKLALRRWAMTIQMDRGRAPYDALPFAIELRPDVIFLLSDGEFPQSIEDLLNKINRIDNLFGDDDPISIVHTISYHSREGESRMRRLAEQHGGRYRHVPKPNR